MPPAQQPPGSIESCLEEKQVDYAWYHLVYLVMIVLETTGVKESQYNQPGVYTMKAQPGSVGAGPYVAVGCQGEWWLVQDSLGLFFFFLSLFILLLGLCPMLEYSTSVSI